MGRAISMHDVLEVLREFERLEPGGVSAGLIAWELYQSDAQIVALIELAREQRLIEQAGVDGRTGEALWRLTATGAGAGTDS